MCIRDSRETVGYFLSWLLAGVRVNRQFRHESKHTWYQVQIVGTPVYTQSRWEHSEIYERSETACHEKRTDKAISCALRFRAFFNIYFSTWKEDGPAYAVRFCTICKIWRDKIWFGNPMAQVVRFWPQNPTTRDFGPKSDDSTHRIIKSKTGIGL